MAGFGTNDPFGEKFETLVSKASSQVKKVASDIKASVTGGVETGNSGTTGSTGMTGNKTGGVDTQVATQAQVEAQQNLQVWRQNVAEMNSKIAKIRQDREKQAQQAKQADKQEKQQKKQEKAQKQQEDKTLQRMLQGRQGSHEGLKKVGG